ncbi:hypothetical protein BpHYR1_025038 [Brachionus plicatilis]|uniref:Uncharacterized protein n=1 Tax=Brachionus plicatilis TaxID=10195 RepID=A0A3M7RPK5_BRAPC|nr:hypothetical protein BpHYR1_025038 [Brachionus plicatilis]
MDVVNVCRPLPQRFLRSSKQLISAKSSKTKHKYLWEVFTKPLGRSFFSSDYVPSKWKSFSRPKCVLFDVIGRRLTKN